jgi:hypothetical protein
MESISNPNHTNNNQGKINLPDSTTILVIGILSIPTCFTIIIGICLGIAAVVLGVSARRRYFANPEKYTKDSFNNANAGYICGLVGLALSVALLMIFLTYIIFVFHTMDEIFRHVFGH